MGWGKRIGHKPATDYEKLAHLRMDYDRYKKMVSGQMAELIEALLKKYLEHPDPATRKVLIMHLGSEFFDRAGE